MSVASTLLAEYEAAISAVLSSAQSYTIGGRAVTRANLAELEKGRDKYKKEVARESRSGVKITGFSCVDK